MPIQQKNYARAASFALSAFTGWTLSDALLKLVRTSGIPAGQLLLISGLSGMAVVFTLCVLRGNVKRLQPHNWRDLFFIGICQAFAWLTWAYALPSLPLVSMYTVAFMTPMTVAVLAAVLLKEHLGWKRATAIAAGFCGVIIAVNPMNLFTGTTPLVPYLLVFGSMVGTASQMLLLRALGKHESSEAMSFYPRLVLVATGMVYCASSGFAAMSGWEFLAICASGALGATGWALISKAYKNAPAAAVAPFHYSQMITGSLLGYFIWGDLPNTYLVAGAMVIIASGVYLVRHERRASRLMVRIE
jgi:drug/metabolite transporter (DMT)-like permease